MKFLKIDSEDLMDVAVKIEKSYQVDFELGNAEFIRTFGDLTDWVTRVMPQPDTDDCTTQQAFYKVRTAFSEVLEMDKAKIHPNTELESIFDRKTRRARVAEIEQKLSIKFDILKSKAFVQNTFIILLLTTLGLLFFRPLYGLMGIAICFCIVMLIKRTQKEFSVKTVGQLTEKVVRENYLLSRRDPSRVNRLEIVEHIKQLLVQDLGLKAAEVTRDMTLVYD